MIDVMSGTVYNFIERYDNSIIKFSMGAAMEIKRDCYLNQLISFAWDGQVKVITGIRRCGKSYLLRVLYKKYLLQSGVPEDHNRPQ